MSLRRLSALLVCLFAASAIAQQASDATEPGLLFHLTGDHGFRADTSAGNTPEPNYVKDVKILPNGTHGNYFQCGNDQLLSYWAPGNIYSQRGTLAFDWRPRDPVDATEFPVFRVGYSDHSSWDMVWLRIDYNGHGFDAFVTDINLGRTRVSVSLQPFPAPDTWTHIALSWDETTGIRFYINGKLAATQKATGMFDAALDQFGPHSRIIGPSGVEATYNYDRGGDIADLRIYDRALSDANIADLPIGHTPTNIPSLTRSLNEPAWQQEWWHNNGWNRANDPPKELPAAATTVRKVEIHDAYDLKRWWWRSTDGIRETTWPGVYNRSTLTGRLDYFQLPDWDCYAVSGHSVTYYLPDEPWNHIEVQGGAWGTFDLLTAAAPGDKNAITDPDQWDASPQIVAPLFSRPEGQERTTHDLVAPITARHVRFTNARPEWPIGEFSAYYVHPGAEPKGIATLSYTITARGDLSNPAVTDLRKFIHDRFPADQRAILVAMPGVALGGGRTAIHSADGAKADKASLPLVHVLVPWDYRGLQADEGHATNYTWENMHAGLDGIAIDLPALNVKPTHGDLIPMNVQIKDPIWPLRDMLDFSFSVRPGEPHTLWLDTRDRILQNRSLYITVASASPEFSAASLEGMKVRLIFKPFNDALAEHTSDRLTQVRDNYSNMVEESVNSRKLNLFNRFDADITDLLRVDPDNDLGRKYWNEMNHEQSQGGVKPPFTLPEAPAGVPQWAFLQARDLDMLNTQIRWWIDHRQISDGEFGGGLSDDSDYLNWWPGLAMMGSDHATLKRSLERALDAMYANGMWANGLASAQYDELHAYEDGLNTLSQAMMMDYGSPKQIERAMVSAKRLEWLTGINSAGQRQVRSAYYSGTKMAENGVWGWAKGRSYMVFHPAILLTSFNGTPRTRQMLTELADGMLAHHHADADGKMRMHYAVNFHTNEDKADGDTPWFMLWSAYRFTGDKKYIAPFYDDGPNSLRLINADALDQLSVRDTWGKQLLASTAPERRNDSSSSNETNLHFAWQLTGDTKNLERLYAAQIETATNRKFINTEGSLWIDRIYFNNGELQRARLGGVALMRNYIYPGNVVSWQLSSEGNHDATQIEHVGILVPEGTPQHIRILVHNIEDHPVHAVMTGWEIDPGQWEMKEGTQNAGGTTNVTHTSSVVFERSSDLTFTFAPHVTQTIELSLQTPGTPYWSRYDLGIDPYDVTVTGHTMSVKVHSLGAVAAPPAKIVVRDAANTVIATAPTPTLAAPVDLEPKTAVVRLNIPARANLRGAIVTIESDGKSPEITLKNNHITLQ